MDCSIKKASNEGVAAKQNLQALMDCIIKKASNEGVVAYQNLRAVMDCSIKIGEQLKDYS